MRYLSMANVLLFIGGFLTGLFAVGLFMTVVSFMALSANIDAPWFDSRADGWLALGFLIGGLVCAVSTVTHKAAK